MAGHPLAKCKAKESPTLTDIAWAAGIYEGEGSITKAGTRKGSLRVVVCQKDHWLLKKLANLFGGSVYGPYPSQNVATWQVSGPRARGFILTIFTWLSPRRRCQVRKMLEV